VKKLLVKINLVTLMKLCIIVNCGKKTSLSKIMFNMINNYQSLYKLMNGGFDQNN